MLKRREFHLVPPDSAKRTSQRKMPATNLQLALHRLDELQGQLIGITAKNEMFLQAVATLQKVLDLPLGLYETSSVSYVVVDA